MADTIMTTTLPTIVGMGVASRAVDTMFSRRGRGARRPKKGHGPMIHKGPRGGRYIIRKGRRVYI